VISGSPSRDGPDFARIDEESTRKQDGFPAPRTFPLQRAVCHPRQFHYDLAAVRDVKMTIQDFCDFDSTTKAVVQGIGHQESPAEIHSIAADGSGDPSDGNRTEKLTERFGHV
jgi:hypothetical protein